MKSNFISFDETDILNLSPDTEEFKEFCEDIEALDNLFPEKEDEFVLEKVHDDASRLRHDFRQSMKNTYKSTKDIAKAYNTATSAGGNLASAIWATMMKAIRLITKLFAFVTNKIAKIPLGIVKLIDRITDIPTNIINKIKGNIKLYITAEDIYDLYNKHLMLDLDRFIAEGHTVVKGQTFTSFFHKKGIPLVGQNDTKLCKRMQYNFNKIKYLDFQKTVIDLRDEKTINTYFSNQKTIQFKSLDGYEFHGSYLEALKMLIVTLNSRKREIADIGDLFSEKYTRSLSNDSFANLSGPAQNIIQETITMFSKISTVIAKIVKYTTEDIYTMTQAIDKLTKKDRMPDVDNNKSE